MVTISDRWVGHNTSGTTIDYYEASTVSASDYYPFGMGCQRGDTWQQITVLDSMVKNEALKLTRLVIVTAEFWQYDSGSIGEINLVVPNNNGGNNSQSSTHVERLPFLFYPIVLL